VVFYFNIEPRLKWNKNVSNAAKTISFHFRRHDLNKINNFILFQSLRLKWNEIVLAALETLSTNFISFQTSRLKQNKIKLF